MLSHTGHFHWLQQQQAASPAKPQPLTCPKCGSTGTPRVKGKQVRCGTCGALQTVSPGTAKAAESHA